MAPDVAVLGLRLGPEVARVLTRVRPELSVLLVADAVPDPEQVRACGARGAVGGRGFASADLARLWD